MWSKPLTCLWSGTFMSQWNTTHRVAGPMKYECRGMTDDNNNNNMCVFLYVFVGFKCENTQKYIWIGSNAKLTNRPRGTEGRLVDAHTHTHTHARGHIQKGEIHAQRRWLLNNSAYTNTHWRQGEPKSTAKLTGRAVWPLQCQHPIRVERRGHGRETWPPVTPDSNDL